VRASIFLSWLSESRSSWIVVIFLSPSIFYIFVDIILMVLAVVRFLRPSMLVRGLKESYSFSTEVSFANASTFKRLH